jgi:hypothetical protein
MLRLVPLDTSKATLPVPVRFQCNIRLLLSLAGYHGPILLLLADTSVDLPDISLGSLSLLRFVELLLLN